MSPPQPTTPRPTEPDPWGELRSFTAARIALGRAGASLPTREVLDFGTAHALARDAVHTPLATTSVIESLRERGFDALSVRSAAVSRPEYLMRPDLGRRLDARSASEVDARACVAPQPDLLCVVGDGLSADAIHRHALPLLDLLRAELSAEFHFGPVVVEQARVAIGDDIGQRFGARLVLVLIGERPGLSSPDSLGAYLTWQPRVGRTDAERNCVSNIRPAGLAYADAARTLSWLVRAAHRGQLSGVALKPEAALSPPDPIP